MTLNSFQAPPAPRPLRRRSVHRLPAAWPGFVAVIAAFFALSLTESRAQLPQINEFLAVNTKGAVDEDGTFQPWIEIYNAQTAKYNADGTQTSSGVVSLSGYKLTDGTNTWAFPSVQIMPDDRILVWASGKDRKVVTAPLHTNFTIPAGGGTLSLLNSSNTVVSSFIAYPAQTADVSWGRDISDVNTTASPPATSVVGDKTQTGFYQTPTPGEANNFTGDGVAGEVVFSIPTRAFASTDTMSLSLSLAVADPDAVIRYTLSTTNAAVTASTPSATSTVYTTPLTITATTLVRARVFKTGKLPGPTGTRGYLLLNANAVNFTSSMPIVVVSNFTGTIPNDGDQAAYMWVWEPAASDNLSRFSNAPTQFNRVVIDKRGSSTLGNAKPSLNLETRTQTNEEEEEVAFFGMPAHSDWVLYAPFSFDPSLLHNPFVYALSNNIGRYAVRNKPVEMFVKTTSGALSFTNSNTGDYYGVYNFMEKIRRNSDRVDIKKMDTYSNDAVSKTGGYIWKVDRIDSGDTGFTTGGQTMAFYYPKERELKSPQRDPQEQYLASTSVTVGYIAAFNSALQKSTFTDPVLGYAPYLDVDAAIDHHLINTWAFNVDALRLSGYWTKDREGKMFPGPIWDFDRALSSTDGRDANPKMWRSNSGDLGTDFFNFTWWNRLFRDPDFYQKYVDRWQSLRRTGAFAPTAINALLDDLNSQMSAESVARDLKRWNNAKRAWTTAMGALNPVTTASQAAEVQRLKDYLQIRATWMDTQWVAPPDTVTAAGYVPVGTQITLTGPTAGTIYYTMDGSDPRPTGGAAPGAGPLTYSGPITINANTRIRARVYNPSFTALTGANNPPLVCKWSGPLDRSYTIDPPAAPGDIVISEINYHPADPTPAELAVNSGWGDKDFEFLEIRNITSHPVSLNSAAFTAGVTYAFTGAAARSLAPGETLVIASNPTAFAARYGTTIVPAGPFSGDLSNSSETVTLTSNAVTPAVPIASVTYSDKWAPTSDGGGFSLVAYNVFPDDINKAAAWKASSAANGSPGSWDSASLAFTAGPDLSAPAGAALSLSGKVLGDLSGGTPVWAWSKVSGPGEVNFATPAALATSATVTSGGAYILRLSLTYNGVTTTDELNATITSTVETPEMWLANHPGIGGLADDFDKDGRNNLEEFAFNTDPSVPNGGEPPVFTTENGKSVLTYPRRKTGSGVTYTVEISNDLGTFRLPKAGELTEQILSDDGLMETVKVTDTVTQAAEPRRFLRLKMATIP